MNCKKKAFTLLEIIIVLFISSIVLIYSFSFTKELFLTQKDNERIASLKLDLNSSKIIIRKNLPKSINLLSYDGSTLFYDGYILLENVTSYSQNSSSDILTIEITLDNSISQIWKFKL